MLLTRRFVLAAAPAFLLGACSAAGVSVPGGATSVAALSTATVTAEVNATRKHYGAPELRYNPTLAAQARTQASLMAARGEISHTLGGTLHDRTIAAGYEGATGENLAEGQKTLEAVIGDWLKSPGHRETLLNRRFVEFGLAAATGSNGRAYWAFIAGGPFENWRR